MILQLLIDNPDSYVESSDTDEILEFVDHVDLLSHVLEGKLPANLAVTDETDTHFFRSSNLSETRNRI